MSADPAPQTIEVTPQNVWGFLGEYVNFVQQRGKYTLQEASVLKQALDVVLQPASASAAGMPITRAQEVVVQGLHVGQQRGAFTLQDAEVLTRLLTVVESQPTGTSVDTTSLQTIAEAEEDDDDDDDSDSDSADEDA